jgi:hypothetical protein
MQFFRFDDFEGVQEQCAGPVLLPCRGEQACIRRLAAGKYHPDAMLPCFQGIAGAISLIVALPGKTA